MSNGRKDNEGRRDPRRPLVSPKLCDGIPIRGADSLNKLFKSQRQERLKERGFAASRGLSVQRSFYDRR